MSSYGIWIGFALCLSSFLPFYVGGACDYKFDEYNEPFTPRADAIAFITLLIGGSIISVLALTIWSFGII